MSDAAAPAVDLLPIDHLDRAIVDLAYRINAATYELLVLIRQFDERAGWRKWSFLNCAEWLHWRCDLSLSAAREKVRVAHALKTLPRISAAFQRGALSYSKVRALTRVARRDNEEQLVDFALKTTASRVEERCRELRCGTAASVAEANREQARRSLTLRRDLEHGRMTITVELPLEAGELIDRALDKARDDTPAAEFANDSWSSRQADALVTMARDCLCGQSGEAAGTADNYLVNVHVEHSALAEGQGRSGLPRETRLDNLLLLCSRHHRLVHEGGYRIDKDYRDRWIFLCPDGIAVPPRGYRADDTRDEVVGTEINDLQRPSAEGLLSAVEKAAKSSPLHTSGPP